MVTDDGWTIKEACEQFAAAGVPITPYRFGLVIRAVQLPAAGRAPSPGPQGGRGQTLYPISELQRLHSALAPWLITRPDP